MYGGQGEVTGQIASFEVFGTTGKPAVRGVFIARSRPSR